MKTTAYLSRKLLNQLKVKETESKDLILMHSTTVHGFLPTQTLLQNSMANRFLSRNPTRNSTKPIFGPSLPLGLKQT